MYCYYYIISGGSSTNSTAAFAIAVSEDLAKSPPIVVHFTVELKPNAP